MIVALNIFGMSQIFGPGKNTEANLVETNQHPVVIGRVFLYGVSGKEEAYFLRS